MSQRAAARASRRRSQGPSPTDARRARMSLVLRVGALGAISLVVAVAAIALVITRLGGPAPTDTRAIQVLTTMAGFEPGALTARAGEQVRIELVNRDTPYHTDGGGIHSLHVDELNVHERVDPLSTRVIEFTAPAQPGTYAFYCDTCCGGKENPAMQGLLTVTA